MSEEKTYNKPLPDFRPETKPYWEGAKNHALVLPRSKETGKFFFYPRAMSPGFTAASAWSGVCLPPKPLLHAVLVKFSEVLRGGAGPAPFHETALANPRVTAINLSVKSSLNIGGARLADEPRYN